MNLKVLAGIVTYNRVKLLERCLNSLNMQKRKCEEIIVINNGSTDGTSDYLSKNKIKYINNENTGSALGWFKAIEYAVNNEFDLIWLMDDDGYPDQNALLNLINKFEISQFACLSSIVLEENNNRKLVFPIAKLKKNKMPIIFSIQRKYKTLNECIQNSKNELIPGAHLFNGSLINVKFINKIGNVNVKYYHHGNELDYLYRLFKNGKVFTCCNALHFHPNTDRRKISMLWIYYYVKNSLIINSKYLDNTFIRNIGVILICLVRIIKRNGWKYFIVDFLFSKNIYYFFLAIFKGLNNKIGEDKINL